MAQWSSPMEEALETTCCTRIIMLGRILQVPCSELIASPENPRFFSLVLSIDRPKVIRWVWPLGKAVHSARTCMSWTSKVPVLILLYWNVFNHQVKFLYLPKGVHGQLTPYLCEWTSVRSANSESSFSSLTQLPRSSGESVRVDKLQSSTQVKFLRLHRCGSRPVEHSGIFFMYSNKMAESSESNPTVRLCLSRQRFQALRMVETLFSMRLANICMWVSKTWSMMFLLVRF